MVDEAPLIHTDISIELDERRFRALLRGRTLTIRHHGIQVAIVLAEMEWNEIIKAVADGILSS
jgi:hypothetical protein